MTRNVMVNMVYKGKVVCTKYTMVVATNEKRRFIAYVFFVKQKFIIFPYV